MQPIPLISAEYVARVAGELARQGVPVDRYLEAAQLPPGLLEAPAGFVPGRSLWVLAELVERSQGLGDFWLESARKSPWFRASWARALRRASTLREAILAMCASYPRQVAMNQLGLGVDGCVAWFWRRRVCDVRGWPANEPAEQYTLSLMLEVIRTAAGPAWLPERLKVECAPSGWVSTSGLLPGVSSECGQPVLAVAIPLPLLSLPFSLPAETASEVETSPPSASFRGSLRQVLEPLLVYGLPDQETAAEILWTTPRTLRRRLAEEGSSWHAVVDDLKFEKAIARIQEGRLSLGEIAEELGYSHPGHFTRFFRRRAGLSPSAYREKTGHARERARSCLA